MKCVLCGRDCESEEIKGMGIVENRCDICGNYRIESRDHGIDDAIKRNRLHEKWILSGICRQLKENGDKTLNFCDYDETMKIISQIRIPQNPLEKIDMLLEYFSKESAHFYKTVLFDPNSGYPVCFAKNPEEMRGFLEAATQLGYIDEPSGLSKTDKEIGMQYVLTLKGWERIDEIRKNKPTGDQCFVAMWFDDTFFSDTFPSIKQAVEESGYRAECVKIKIHNNKICDEIMAGIRKSSLVIADMTDERFAVSFEAGFAMGLNIPVIFTCRNGTDIKKNFDIRQYPHIIWSDKDDLKNQLSKKIQALYPVKIMAK